LLRSFALRHCGTKNSLTFAKHVNSLRVIEPSRRHYSEPRIVRLARRIGSHRVAIAGEHINPGFYLALLKHNRIRAEIIIARFQLNISMSRLSRSLISSSVRYTVDRDREKSTMAARSLSDLFHATRRAEQVRQAPRALSFLLLLSVVAPFAAAQTPSTVFLDDLTSTELQEQIRSGKTTVIVPIGGTEQSGPHMALGKHNVRVKALAEKIAVALGNALVAPVVAYVPEGSISPPTAHMRFPGTITVPDETFEKVLEYAARSFKLHGFHDIVLLGDHGGYQKDEKAVAERLNREWAATSVRVIAPEEYYRSTQTAYVQALKSRGYRDEEIGTHAGLADTSLMLALDPRLVRMDRLQSASKRGRSDGVYGDPSRSSAELGKLGTDAVVTQTVEAIRKAVARR
jgi:creatinine amidohydrolase